MRRHHITTPRLCRVWDLLSVFCMWWWSGIGCRGLGLSMVAVEMCTSGFGVSHLCMLVFLVWQVFYGRSEPTYILNNHQPMVPYRYPPPQGGEMVRQLQAYPRDVTPPRYRTKALVGPQNGAVSRIMHQSPVCSCCCLPLLPRPS